MPCCVMRTHEQLPLSAEALMPHPDVQEPDAGEDKVPRRKEHSVSVERLTQIVVGGLFRFSGKDVNAT